MNAGYLSRGLWDVAAHDHMGPRTGGYVYFIQCKSSKNIKIGFSKNPIERVRGIAQCSGGGIKVLAIAPGTEKTERWYFNLFSSDRIHGEWFRYSHRLRQWAHMIRLYQYEFSRMTIAQLRILRRQSKVGASLTRRIMAEFGVIEQVHGRSELEEEARTVKLNNPFSRCASFTSFMGRSLINTLPEWCRNRFREDAA